MLTTSSSLWLGVTFLVVGAVNVWLILQSSARVKDAKASSRLIAAHRIGGYIFIALFSVMAYFMLSRLGDAGSTTPSSTMIHLTLAMVLSPLLFVKVLIARYYKNFYGVLMAIGLMIFTLSFVLIAIPAAPYLAHRVRMQTVSLDAIDLPPATIDINLGAETMQKRCSRCHNLDRVVGARKDTRGWLATVSRMQSLPGSGISDADTRIIVSYLASQLEPRGSAGGLEVERAVVDQRCAHCHSLDRVYQSVQTPEEWKSTVERMVGYAGGNNAFHPGEVQQVIHYLSAMLTPESINRRKAQANTTLAGGPSLLPGKTQPLAPIPPVKRTDGTLIAFLALLTGGTLTLILRRPARPVVPGTRFQAPTTAPTIAMPATGRPLILRLAGVTEQTHDAKTLRFIVPDDQRFTARPGQFLTFSFLLDGKKLMRSYSISSSPARSAYVEITPKRVATGSVSIFLNDRATVGLTVEAKGAFGQFYFDESRHHNVVLLAAGSGITPMMAMLRYMDDLCLESSATLLYCVRTRRDIIFHRELEELRTRLKNFRYHVLLSKPDDDWSGPRGHISRELILDYVQQTDGQDFFLCGPPPFMEASCAVLAALGVKPERIKQERFGSGVAKKPMSVETANDVETANEAGVLIEFVQSGKTFMARKGQTVLEAAEEHGVNLPSSCRQGQCGTCKTRLLEGTVRMDAEAGLDADSRAQGFVLTCVGHAQSVLKFDA